MYTPEEIQNGCFMLFDKPMRLTSFDVVYRVRRTLRNYCGVKNLKVGHAGTLDPLATGLLILATGKFTKRIDEIQAADKEYCGTCCLGATTASYDLEKEPENFSSLDAINDEIILSIAKKFIGNIKQVPPIHSAIKKDGQRAFHKARAGKEITLEARNVTIQTFTITSISMPFVDFTVQCSKGTYIRSLVHDYGMALGCGAYLSALRRTRIGSYTLANACQLDAFINAYTRGDVENI
jgi:tRNA pseudouridine55 synthase